MAITWKIKAFDELTVHELYEIFHLRLAVFAVEQNAVYQDADGKKDLKSYHICGRNEQGELIAYARIIPAGLAYEGPRFQGMAPRPFQHQHTQHAARGVAARAFGEAARIAAAVAADSAILDSVDAGIDQIAAALAKGGKVLICGNGGSLADATHFAEELTGRFRKDRPALAAIAIADAGHLTCTANDFGFDHVFSRGVEALGRPGDVLIALSTSGNSKNVLLALEAAKERGMSSISLLGKSGGHCKGVATREIIVPGETADRIQEVHMLILHTLVEGVEKALGLA